MHKALIMASYLALLMPLVGLAATEPTEDLEQTVEQVAQPKTPNTSLEFTPQQTQAKAEAVSMPAIARDGVLNPGSDKSNSPLTLSRIVISLALVILLVLGLGWLFKKLTLRLPGNRQIKVICAMPLGQRERILVIEIQGKQRVIGVTPQSINLLFELENPLPEEKLASDFHTQLQSFLKK